MGLERSLFLLFMCFSYLHRFVRCLHPNSLCVPHYYTYIICHMSIFFNPPIPPKNHSSSCISISSLAAGTLPPPSRSKSGCVTRWRPWRRCGPRAHVARTFAALLLIYGHCNCMLDKIKKSSRSKNPPLFKLQLDFLPSPPSLTAVYYPLLLPPSLPLSFPSAHTNPTICLLLYYTIPSPH